MADDSLQMPKFHVGLVGKEPFDVVIPNGVQVQWELERARKGYPDSSEAPTTWAAFVCWAAAKRGGQVESNMPFEAFVDTLDVLRFEDPVEAKPTKRGRGAAS